MSQAISDLSPPENGHSSREFPMTAPPPLIPPVMTGRWPDAQLEQDRAGLAGGRDGRLHAREQRPDRSIRQVAPRMSHSTDPYLQRLALMPVRTAIKALRLELRETLRSGVAAAWGCRGQSRWTGSAADRVRHVAPSRVRYGHHRVDNRASDGRNSGLTREKKYPAAAPAQRNELDPGRSRSADRHDPAEGNRARGR